MNTATYSPEDNKLRLYVGRVPRDEYERLRAEGWTSTPKQNCDFVATWTPQRRNTALEYAEIIEDEDMGPEERAADRAERFGEYRDKRTSEAVGHADRFDSGPIAHGYQSQARAERAAARHDRIGTYATDAWSKAEYWQRRTAGVIGHALYKSSPGVRMGRIKTLESELRKLVAAREDWAKVWRTWKKLSEMTDQEEQTKLVRAYAGTYHGGGHMNFKHPRPETVNNTHIRENGASLWSLMEMTESGMGSDNITGAEACALWLADHPNEPKLESDWTRHYELRLAYERQMLEAQGGRAAMIEMEVGGWLGNYQIRKVNKSNATGRVVSVQIFAPPRYSKDNKPALIVVNIERLDVSAYRPPSEADKAALEEIKKAEKAAAPKKAACPLINPTDADAERLQAILNERYKADHCARHMKAYGKDYVDEFKPSTVCRITQKTYSEVSKGSYARAETRGLCRDGNLEERQYNMYSRERTERERLRGPAVCLVRRTGGDGSNYGAPRIIVLTDKAQKPFPAEVWEKYNPEPKLELATV